MNENEEFGKIVDGIEKLDSGLSLDEEDDDLPIEVKSSSKKYKITSKKDKEITIEERQLIEEFIHTKGITKIKAPPTYVDGALKNDWDFGNIKSRD